MLSKTIKIGKEIFHIWVKHRTLTGQMLNKQLSLTGGLFQCELTTLLFLNMCPLITLYHVTSCALPPYTSPPPPNGPGGLIKFSLVSFLKTFRSEFK